MASVRILIVLGGSFALACCCEGAGWYVDVLADPGQADGLSWGTAFSSLQDALSAAGPGDKIYLAQGIYKPDPAEQDVLISFTIPDGVALLGGYAGLGMQDPNHRDPNIYHSILSGEYGDSGVFSDNARHVTKLFLASSGTLLEGLTIRGGAAIDAPPDQEGGGILAQLSSPTIRQCRFENNHAESGAAIAVSAGQPLIERCSFVDNVSSFSGGAIFLQSAAAQIVDCQFLQNFADFEGGAVMTNSSDTVLTGCVFTQNLARDRGGAIMIARGLPTLSGCNFDDNKVIGLGSVDGGGGAVAMRDAEVRASRLVLIENDSTRPGGGLVLLSGTLTLMNTEFRSNTSNDIGGALTLIDGEAWITNCVMNSNLAGAAGGGIHVDEATLTLTNTTVVANHAFGIAGGGVFNEDGDVTINNCILWANQSLSGSGEEAQLSTGFGQPAFTLNHSVVQAWSGSWPGQGCLADDPRFTNAQGPDGIWGSADDQLTLRQDSPCIDRGRSALIPADAIDLDADGDPVEPVPLDLADRFRQVDDALIPNIDPNELLPVDIGAYEFIQFGDLNCDGWVNAFDIDPFVLAILDPVMYELQYPDCDLALADTNEDGNVNSFDIDSFVDSIIEGLQAPRGSRTGCYVGRRMPYFFKR
jgi:hypothetical protein